jgi:hypothetical protein
MGVFVTRIDTEYIEMYMLILTRLEDLEAVYGAAALLQKKGNIEGVMCSAAILL